MFADAQMETIRPEELEILQLDRLKRQVAWAAEKSGIGKNEIFFNLGDVPQTLDPALSHALTSLNVVENTFEGLLRIGLDSRPEAGCAESWEVSEDGLTWTFHLRPNLKWSDGKPLAAEDFRYGFMRALDPSVAAPYANFAFFVKNGEAFSKGEAKAEDVGLTAVDDRTFRVDLEHKFPILLEYLTFAVLRPTRRDVVEADPQGWANKPETHICNGPFMLESCRLAEGGEIVLAKNPYHYGAEGVKVDRVHMAFISDRNDVLDAFEGGRLDYVSGPPPHEPQRPLTRGEVKPLPAMGPEFCRFNTTRPPFNDPQVRHAFVLAIDRKAIVEKVLRGGQRPARGIVPYNVPGARPDRDFRAEGGAFLPEEADVGEARRLLAEAGYPEGKGFPKITYKYNANSVNKLLAEALQDAWKQALGVEMELLDMPWKDFVVIRREIDYDIARSSWVMDILDAGNVLDLFTSNSRQNHTGYANLAYDEMIAGASREMNPFRRIRMLHEAERILMEDLPVAPIYFYSLIVMESPRVKGIRHTLYDRVLFRNAEVVE